MQEPNRVRPSGRRGQVHNRIQLIAGKKGTGKTTLLSRIFAQSESLTVGFDLTGDLARETGAYVIHGGRRFLGMAKAHRLRLRQVVLGGPQDLEAVAHWCWLTGRCHLVVDEIDRFYGVGGRDPWLDEIVTRGRHKHIDLTGAATRWARVHVDLISAADELHVFRFQEENDLKKLAAFVGNALAAECSALGSFRFHTFPRAGT